MVFLGNTIKLQNRPSRAGPFIFFHHYLVIRQMVVNIIGILFLLGITEKNPGQTGMAW